MRVLVTGMGGELGTRVTNLLEADPAIEAIVGVDIDPPRTRIPRAHFHLVDPRDRVRTVAVVKDLEPTAVLHLGVYEPGARVGARASSGLNAASALVALGAAAQCPSLDRIVVRSGIEVYGRPRGGPHKPDETVVPQPTTPWGRSLAEVEAVAAEAGAAADVPVSVLRFAPVVGPHIPSPLGRYLRLPAVPVSALADPPFSLLHQEDAAAAAVRALGAGVDGTVNVVGPGAVTPFQAVRLGGRIPLPTVGLGWAAARVACELAGTPLPAHVIELLTRGRGADGALGEAMLGLGPARSTVEVVRDVYEWAEVVHLDVDHRERGVTVIDPITPAAFVRRRLDGTHEVDEWGLDPDVVGLLSPLVGLRWNVETQWPEHVPTSGPAVLVHNRALGVSEPVALARGVREATGRHVRTAGLVDVAPFATLGRMLGGVADRPDELTGLLRDGHLVALPLDRDLRARRAGGLSAAALAPALATGAPVVPVALVGREVGRHWRMLVGAPLAPPPGRGPLAVADLVDAARAGVQSLLDSVSGPLGGWR